jgi:hypothetical protein
VFALSIAQRFQALPAPHLVLSFNCLLLLLLQVGVTPAGVEVPRCLVEPEVCQQQVAALQLEQQPTLPTGPGAQERRFCSQDLVDVLS